MSGISHPMLVLQEYIKCSSSVHSKRCWMCWKCPCSRYIYRLALSLVLTVGSISCGNLEFLHTCIFVGMQMSNLLKNNLEYISKWTSDLD